MTSLMLLAVLAAGPTKPALTVLYFENNTAKSEYDVMRKGLADMMVTDLVAWDGVTVLEREKLEAVLGELKLQQSKAFDSSTAAKVGKLMGAKYLLTGTMLLPAGELLIECKLISAEDSRVLVSARAQGSPDKIFDLEQDLIGKVTPAIDAKLNDPGQRRKAKVPDLSALLAYSKALDLTDQGKLDEADAAFQALVSARPSFLLARDRKDEMLKRLQEAEARRKDLLSGAGAELAKKVEAAFAAPAKLDALPPEEAKQLLILRAYRGYFLLAALKQHLSSHDDTVKLVLKGHEAQALAGMRAWLENQRQLAEDYDTYVRVQNKGVRAPVVAPLDRAFGEPGQQLQVGQDSEQQQLEFILRGRVMAPGGLRFVVGPALGDLDPKEGQWAMDALERQWTAAVAAAKSGNPATASSGLYKAASVAKDLAETLVWQEKIEDAVAKLQRFLDAFPESAQFKDIERKLREYLEPDRNYELSKFEDWGRALKGCNDMDIRKGIDVINRRSTRLGLGAIPQAIAELDKACKGKPKTDGALAQAYAQAARLAAHHDDCDTFRALYKKNLAAGGEYWEMCQFQKHAPWCPLGDAAPYPERELVWKLPPELLKFGQINLMITQEVPGSKWGRQVNRDSLMPGVHPLTGEVVWNYCLAPGKYRAEASGLRWPEEHVYQFDFDPGPTRKTFELTLKKVRVDKM